MRNMELKREAESSLAEFGRLIAERRNDLGLSLRALEQRSGVSYSWLSKIEHGKAPTIPGVEKLAGLSSALDLSIVELLLAAGIPTELVLPKPATYRRLRARP